MSVTVWQQDTALERHVSSDAEVENMEATGLRDTEIRDLP